MKTKTVINSLKILSDNWERFKLNHPAYDTPHVNRQIQLVLNCSDPQFGFKQYMCLDCGSESKVVANSCKSKFCLRCGRVDGENLGSLRAHLLVVPDLGRGV